jgi:hypothetical protein
MPSTRTISGSRAPARMIRPKRVFSMNSQSASTTTAVAPISTSRYSGKWPKPRLTAPRSASGVDDGRPSMPNSHPDRLDQHVRQAEGEQQRVVDAAAVQRPHQEALGQQADAPTTSGVTPG